MSEQQLARLNEFMRRCPYHRWLGCLITTHDPSGELEVVLPFREEMQSGDADETAHGGLVATLIDIAAHAALHARTGFGVRTISLQVNYLRPAMTPLAARARPLLIGKTVGYVDVEVFDRRRERAGLGRAVFSTRSPAQAERQ